MLILPTAALLSRRLINEPESSMQEDTKNLDDEVRVLRNEKARLKRELRELEALKNQVWPALNINPLVACVEY